MDTTLLGPVLSLATVSLAGYALYTSQQARRYATGVLVQTVSKCVDTYVDVKHWCYEVSGQTAPVEQAGQELQDMRGEPHDEIANVLLFVDANGGCPDCEDCCLGCSDVGGNGCPDCEDSFRTGTGKTLVPLANPELCNKTQSYLTANWARYFGAGARATLLTVKEELTGLNAVRKIIVNMVYDPCETTLL